MNKVYLYINGFSGKADSSAFLHDAIEEFCDETGIENLEVSRISSGKPVFNKDGVFLSVSHTKDTFFAVFGFFPIGIDAENITEPKTNVAKRFFDEEEQKLDFFYVWCAKEATSKIGGEGLYAMTKIKISDGESTYLDKKYKLFEIEIPNKKVIIASEEEISGVQLI